MKKLATLVAGTAAIWGAALWADGCATAAGAPCKAAAVPEAQAAQAATISPAGLDALRQAGTAVLIFDARSGRFDDGRRVPGARSLTTQASAGEVAKLIPVKDALIVTYCANPKCQASPQLVQHLRSLGYSNILEMPAGIDGWVAEGRAVETAK